MRQRAAKGPRGPYRVSTYVLKCQTLEQPLRGPLPLKRLYSNHAISNPLPTATINRNAQQSLLSVNLAVLELILSGNLRGLAHPTHRQLLVQAYSTYAQYCSTICICIRTCIYFMSAYTRTAGATSDEANCKQNCLDQGIL